MPENSEFSLTEHQVRTFIDDGFVKIDNAFSPDLARQCREELWAEIGLSPDEPEHWVQPVIRVAHKASPPSSKPPTRRACTAPTISS